METGMRTLFLMTILSMAMLAVAQNHHHQDMQQRGNAGMGFDQEKTTHHFLLTRDGGIIQVTANSAADTDSLGEIRMHLQHIQHAFKSGDFNIPMFVHNQTPPGVATMKSLKQQIEYKYEPIENGGRVIINSGNAQAVKAVHDFLRFQIREHRTGDPLVLK
jgi:hypothetical protein